MQEELISPPLGLIIWLRSNEMRRTFRFVSFETCGNQVIHESRIEQQLADLSIEGTSIPSFIFIIHLTVQMIPHIPLTGANLASHHPIG
jgi:hypothetical protein